MTTYITRQVRFLVSEKQNGENQVIKRGDRETKFEAIDTLAEGEFKKWVLVLPITDKDLLGGSTIATGKILYIETDTEMVVKLGTVGDTGFTVKPIVAADTEKRRGILYLESAFAHVYVTPVGSSGNANVVVGVVGA